MLAITITIAHLTITITNFTIHIIGRKISQLQLQLHWLTVINYS